MPEFYDKSLMRYPKIGLFLQEEYKKRYVKKNFSYSQSVFALELEITQPTLSNLMRGTVKPSSKTADIIANSLGPEFYDACDLPRKMPTNKMLRKMSENWYMLEDHEQKQLVETALNMIDKRKQSNESRTEA